jgi:hypothetical protein
MISNLQMVMITPGWLKFEFLINSYPVDQLNFASGIKFPLKFSSLNPFTYCEH